MKTFKRLGHASCLAAVLSFCALSASAAETPDTACAPGRLPSFADYTAQAKYTGKRPKLKLSNEFSRMFRTRLRDDLREQPINFAGHYVLVTIGCGNGCLYGGFVDAETGRATELPFSVNPAGLYREEDPISSRADSRLLVVSGNLNDAEGAAMRYFFVLRHGKLQPICHAPLEAD